MIIRYHRIVAFLIFVSLITLAALTLSILTVTVSDDLAIDGGDLTNIPSKGVVESNDSASQPDIELFYYQLKVADAPEGPTKKFLAQQQLDTVIAYRKHVDTMIELTRTEMAHEALNADLQAQPGKPLVEWECH